MTENLIIERSEDQKIARVNALRAELRGMGYSIIPTEALAALIAEARRQGMLEYAR